jgi:hypothetical protein
LFGTFAAARDAFYGAALLMGLAVGFALRILKTRRHRDVLVTGVMHLFSLALFVTALVLVFSQGAVLYEGGLVRVALFIAVLTVICVFFPVQAAFPAVIIAGVFVVWTAVMFWQYPKEPDSQKSVQVAVRSGDLLPIIGGETRYFDREPANRLLFREEFAILSPAKNRLVFSFVSNRESPPSLSRLTADTLCYFVKGATCVRRDTGPTPVVAFSEGTVRGNPPADPAADTNHNGGRRKN